MGFTDLLADSLHRNLTMANWMLSDFNDADMLVRPVPGANHAAWQIGQVTASEARMGKMLNPGMAFELPAGYAEKFTKHTASIDDPAKFPKKAELLDQLAKVRAASVAIVKTMTEADLATPMQGPMAEFFPTFGHVVVNLIPAHVAMHVGQIQVIRRKLGKPHLM
ncbi:MAG TPA: DinB family protein [Tepidisphaeraceae bacterium]|nr:DinB family protein [Tepidisphaeraceae bacterium]